MRPSLSDRAPLCSMSAAVPVMRGLQWLLLLMLLRLSLTASPASAFASTPPSCFTNFTQALQQLDSFPSTTFSGLIGPYRFPCPAGCLNATRGDRTALVNGSFPYHPSSSVCLAALHSGLMDDREGGVVWLSPFFSQSWDEAAVGLSLIYPHSSARGTYSHGVQSHAVVLPSPATLESYSCVLHSRGTVFNQRRWAPWTPRAGHLHIVSDQFRTDAGRYVFHIIAGGRNATHYMNDVWLYVTLLQDEQFFVTNGRWFRLPDAPWSPRAYQLVGSRESVSPSAWCADPTCRLVVEVLGGEVGHACGLPQLGVCVSDIWRMTATLNSSSLQRISVSWSVSNVTLPFAPRCGSLLMAPPDSVVWAVLGGQLSYEDSTCQSPPVSTNEVWYADIAWPHPQWTQGADAPWSPRRSMLSRSEFLPADFAVMGGIRYVSFTHNATSAQSRLTSALLYADGYVCEFALNVTFGIHCDWSPALGRLTVTAEDWGVAGSLPVPLAHSPQEWTGTNNWWSKSWTGLQFGGISSQAALDRWRDLTVNIFVSGFNHTVPVSMLEQPELLGELFSLTSLEDVMISRHGLPLVYEVSEAELNNASSPFVMGAPGLVTSFLKQYQNGHSISIPSLATAYQLSSQQFGNAPYLYSAHSAAASANTSRGLLDFVYTRHSNGAVACTGIVKDHFPGLLTLSGGVSGSTFYNDWIEYQQLTWFGEQVEGVTGCLPAADPSNLPLLGPGQASACGWESSHQAIVDSLVVAPNTHCEWRCDAGFHLWPPSSDGSDSVTLLCMTDGLWHDPILHVFRSCVADERHCTYPEVDDGDECAEPEPFMSSIMVAGSDTGEAARCPQESNLTVVDCPAALLTLEVVGGFFTQPLAISIGGVPCEYPQLRDHDSNETICDGSADCVVYAPRLLCTVPRIAGYRLPVVVVSGPGRRLAAARDPSAASALANRSAHTPSISYALPMVSSLHAPDCKQGNTSLQLEDCPTSRSFWVAVNGSNLLVAGSKANLTQIYLSGLSSTLRRLSCSWRELDSYDPVMTAELFNCTVPPGAGTLTVLLSVRGLGDNTAQAILPLHQRPTLAYQVCPAGTVANSSVSGDTVISSCELCPPGSSTNGVAGAPKCELCAAGRYNAGTGHGECELCPVGSWSGRGSGGCANCSLNSYSLEPGLSVCDNCTLNQYLSYSPDNSSSLAVQCRACLRSATCWPNGTIAAHFGSFILIDEQAASISAASCHSSACWAGSDCPQQVVDSAPRIPRSHLPVVNCCARGRPPASHNLLCADCLPGYAEWNGACVACSGVDVVGLCGFLLLALLLLYCLHRLPASVEASWLSMLVYYLQMALLFATHDTVPQMLSLVNFDLLGDFHSPARDGQDAAGTGTTTAWCIADMQAWQKIVAHLLMPLAFTAAIAVLLLCQLACRCLLFRSSDAQPRSACSQRLYHLLFAAVDDELQAASSTALLAAQSTARGDAGGGGQLLLLHRVSDSNKKLGLLSEPLLPEQKDGEDEQRETEAVSRSPPLHALEQPLADDAALRSDGLQRHSLLGVSLLAYNRTLLRVVLYSYNNLSMSLLSLFHCQTLDAVHGSRLYSYPSISCSSSTYMRLMPAFVVGLVLVPLGFPLLLLLLLLRHRREQSRPRALGASEAYKEELAARTAYARYGLLYAAYREACWYWSCVVLLQRIVLILVFVFVPSPASFHWLTAINVTILTTHLLVRPYRSVRDNVLEAGLLFLLCLHTSLLPLYPPPLVTNMLSTVIAAVFVVPAVLLKLAVWLAQRPRVRAAAQSSSGWIAQRASRMRQLLSSAQPRGVSPHEARHAGIGALTDNDAL